MLRRLISRYRLILLIFIVAILLYHPLFSLFFFQDDFFHLKMAQANTVSDFINFFSFKNSYSYAFYRPLTTQVFLFMTKSIFGYQPFYYHLIAFIVFCANIFLIYKIVLFILKNNNFSVIVSLLYALSSANMTTLSYISAFEEIGMAFFFFLTILFYLQKRNCVWIFLVFGMGFRLA
ncbi:hypothetical protein COT44_01080 [Candidatus Shapirobacteria bacterium CG08_land_8_20_14_0_20_39_18]|uniref:Glycosyltransferase RgtA/B/C/D-like domain-containing protein n=1 Tax=Candidatus Shapirobacteria bacterium CG08_land_8_20_14_0_20_39_18 TaxID=1974883 RepID=A0A2M6XDZ6_9BACT|nr:MAG: hypothetical protein COT44_01080 [Candidatus Shapirobacteria bacterium CG08_land_8_20_14_0_20_39_18]PJE68028.1 MAG: hypothetical protein COU94_03940 [Candidatus Shapirobacteria bacterium CG10_big_fil_rev_8_21_14_0_10_38_8]